MHQSNYGNCQTRLLFYTNMIILRNKAFASKIDEARYDRENLLDGAAKAEGIISLGALGYGAYKTGQAGKEVYNRISAEKSKLGKLKALKKVGGKVLRGSKKSLKDLETRRNVLEGVEEAAKQEIAGSKEKLKNIEEFVLSNRDKTISTENYNRIKGAITREKKNIQTNKRIVDSVKSTKALNTASKNLKKGKIAGGIALATGVSALALNGAAKATKKKRREKIFSIQSGHPDKEGSLRRELINKAKTGAGLGAVAGGAVGASVGVSTLNLKTLGISTVVGLSLGSLMGALGNMFKAVGADHRMSVAKEVNMNQVLDYLEDIISDSRNKGLDVRGKNLVSRYIGLDQDPKGFNIVLSVRDGVAIFIIYDSIGNKTLDELSKEFEYVVKDNRKATYISEKVKGGYIVQLTIPSVNALANLIYNICYKLHQRINCITKTKM